MSSFFICTVDLQRYFAKDFSTAYICAHCTCIQIIPNFVRSNNTKTKFYDIGTPVVVLMISAREVPSLCNPICSIAVNKSSGNPPGWVVSRLGSAVVNTV